MRFSAIHKLASYLMVAFSFGALALSDELSPWAVLFGGLGVLASWFWEPPRVKVERWTPVWNALAVAAFGYTVLNAISTADWVPPGAHLLVFLMVAKLMSRRSSRDYQWVYILTFLMLVAGTNLNAEMSYAICFLGYVVTATWALILFHLRREMEENFLLKHSDDSSSERVEVERILSSRRIVGPKFLAATAVVSLVVFFLSIMLFLLFPRIGLGLFVKSRSRLSFAGFSDGVSLGGHGVIRNDDTVVMRIKLTDPRFQGPTAPELHWRGVAFDRYLNGRWSRSPKAFGTQVKRSRQSGATRILLDAAKPMGNLEREGLRQEIYVEPLDTPALFAASTPAAFELDDVILGQHSTSGRLGQNDEVRYPHVGGLKYVAYSNVRPPKPAELRGAPDETRSAYDTYLQLPDELPERVRGLGLSIVAGKTTPYEKAEAIAGYLRRNYAYTLTMDSEPGREPIDFFLFDRKKGHCEYFSSAMAVLLRSVGVPARNVNGFLGGEWNEYGKYIAVRSGDAHSWVEVWFGDGLGWVTYDPTPAAPSMARSGDGVFEKLRRLVDNLRLSWFRWVIEYDLTRQLGLFRSVGDVLGMGRDGAFRSGRVTDWLGSHKVQLAAGLSLLVAAAGLWRWWRARRRLGGGIDKLARGSDHPVVSIYAAATRSLARRGHLRAPSATPREFADDLSARSTAGAPEFRGLTELYYAARYAHAPIDLAEAQRLLAAVKESRKTATEKTR
jgi:protein-glutamine gamma-glutamyltransferase